MQDLPIHFAIAGFTALGVGAQAKPAFATARFGILELMPAGRNEMQGVNGGFGIFNSAARVVRPQVTQRLIQPQGNP
jgi:hypothetical protein